MRIAVISDQGSTGGAGVAATRLSRVLRQSGHRTAMLYRGDFWVDSGCADEVFPIHHSLRWAGRAWALHRNTASRVLAQFSWSRAIGKALNAFSPDVVSVHNIHSAEWDTEIVISALVRAPVAWTVHDLWPVTGSCAVPGECRKFTVACDRSCPQAGHPPALPRPMIVGAHRRRLRLFGSASRLALVAPSRWVQSEIETVEGCQGRVFRISHGLDLDLFRPLDRSLSRALLGIPDDGIPTLLTSGHSLRVRRKGLWDLLEALALVAKPVRLLVLGDSEAMASPTNVAVLNVGRVYGDRFLPVVYGAADLMVLPSHAETFGLVVQEALACGRPVVAYDVGAVSELVVDGQTGWLAAGPTIPDLRAVLEKAIYERESWQTMGNRGRAHAEGRFGSRVQGIRYEMLFSALLRSRIPDQAVLDAIV